MAKKNRNIIDNEDYLKIMLAIDEYKLKKEQLIQLLGSNEKSIELNEDWKIRDHLHNQDIDLTLPWHPSGATAKLKSRDGNFILTVSYDDAGRLKYKVTCNTVHSNEYLNCCYELGANYELNDLLSYLNVSVTNPVAGNSWASTEHQLCFELKSVEGDTYRFEMSFSNAYLDVSPVIELSVDVSKENLKVFIDQLKALCKL